MGKCNGSARAVSLHCVCVSVCVSVVQPACLPVCVCVLVCRRLGSVLVLFLVLESLLYARTHNRITQYTRIHYWMGLTNQCRLVHVLLLLTFYLLNILNESFSLVRQKSRQEEEEMCVAANKRSKAGP